MPKKSELKVVKERQPRVVSPWNFQVVGASGKGLTPRASIYYYIYIIFAGPKRGRPT